MREISATIFVLVAFVRYSNVVAFSKYGPIAIDIADSTLMVYDRHFLFKVYGEQKTFLLVIMSISCICGYPVVMVVAGNSFSILGAND
jgi:hypothetical protein